MAFDEALAARIRMRLGKRPGLTEKEIFGGLAFLLHGNMCCGVRGPDMLLRIDPQDTDRALKQRHTRLFSISGRSMKGWILVQPPGLARADALTKWVRMGVTYAASLPPK